jgi:hypothetical protein
LAWSFEYLHHCKSAKNGARILKLYFEKAFDLVEHFSILQILKQKGFDDAWLDLKYFEHFLMAFQAKKIPANVESATVIHYLHFFLPQLLILCRT